MCKIIMQVLIDLDHFSFIFIILVRTNCSNNGTINDQCWRDALAYRSSEFIGRLFSFSSLSVYVDAYQRYHPSEVC
jgi:hypothetical protein